MDGTDQSSLELGEVEVKISKFALHLSTPSALIIQNSMKSVSIKAGEEFSLICEVNGRPTPTILWYKNNLQIKRQWFDYSYVNYGIRIINSGTSELKYQFVTTNDSGNYTCHAQNIYGHVQKSINIEVQFVTSTESITTSTQISATDITGEPISIFDKQFINDKPCFSDQDCNRSSCKMNNSVTRTGSYKTCICSEKNGLPKCQTVEFRKNEIFSSNEQIEQNSFKTCKDGCDPNMSRLFLLSVLSLLLFLLVVFVIMVFITKRQRSRYKLTYSSTKVNSNSNPKNQRCLLVDKNLSLLESSSSTSPCFSWEIMNPGICSEGSKYFTIQPATSAGEKFYCLENPEELKLNCEKSNPKSRLSFFEKIMFLPAITKEDIHCSMQSDNSDFHHQGPATITNKDNGFISSNILMNNFNNCHPKPLDSSLNSLNEIL